MSSGDSHRARRRRRRRLKKTYRRALVGAVNRIDFLSILEGIALSRAGRPWMEKLAHMPDCWPQQEELKQLAARLTLEQMAEGGEKADPQRVAARVEQVACRYDPEIHRKAAAALTVILNHLFVQQDPQNPFTSPDGRDLAHLDQLQDYRRQGLGVVYLVNHSSHLDEFLVDCLAATRGLGLPLFAAGANMMAIESVARVLMVGSYVVQRRGADKLGLAALYNYCRAISEMGQQQAIFLEAWHGGARSRDGSLRYPRRLVTLRGALATEGDLVVQPVAISYSVVPEDLPLAARGSGWSWIRGMGFWSTWGRALLHPKSFLWRAAQGLYGRAALTMPRPLLLSQLRAEHASHRGGLHLDEFVALKAIQEIARTKKVMASQLAARALARARREGEGELAQALEYEKGLLREYHLATFQQEPDLEDFIRQNEPQQVLADGLATLKRRAVLHRWKKDRNKLPAVRSEAGLSFYATHGDRRIYSPTADQNLVVVGANDWGFALTYLVGHRILEEKRYLNASLTLFDSRPEVAAEMGVMRHPPGRFQEYRLPKNAFVTSDAPSAFRKASEVILAPSPPDLREKAELMLKTSEQALKVVVVTFGFEPREHKLPCQVVRDLARQMGRSDIQVYALVGPVKDKWLVEGLPARGILAGPQPGRSLLADLFNWPPVEVVEAEDPLGNQAAAILARLYALWGNYLAHRGEIKGAAATGHYMARAATEAAALGRALGGDPATFAPGCAAWTATLVNEGLTGLHREFARKLAKSAKKPEDVAALVPRLRQQMEEPGRRLSAVDDIKSAYLAAREQGLELALLERAHQTFWGQQD